MDIVLPLLLQIFLIILNAIFACAEIAVISTNEAKINKLILEGNSNAKSLQKLVDNPSNFLSTIQIAITISGFLGSAFAADNFATMLTNWLLKINIATENTVAVFDTISVIIITLILSYFTLVFGELIPKRIGMKKAENIALFLAKPLLIIASVFKPIVWLLTQSINAVLKLIGIDPFESDGDEGEENIRMMVDMSSEKGLIDKEEQEIIQNVFEFDDLTANEFATHRINIDVLWEEDDIKVWDETIRNSFHKYYPICKESHDDIIGVLSVKKYFKNKCKSKADAFKECVIQPYFVIETIKADVLFKQMKQTGNNFAIILDEHGGVEGIVTMSDVIEQIVGDFNFEENCEKEIIEKIDESTWTLSGSATIEDVNKELNTNFNTSEYDTFGGFIFGLLGEIPDDNTQLSVDIEGFKINIVEIEEHKIKKMIVQTI